MIEMGLIYKMDWIVGHNRNHVTLVLDPLKDQGDLPFILIEGQEPAIAVSHRDTDILYSPLSQWEIQGVVITLVEQDIAIPAARQGYLSNQVSLARCPTWPGFDGRSC